MATIDMPVQIELGPELRRSLDAIKADVSDAIDRMGESHRAMAALGEMVDYAGEVVVNHTDGIYRATYRIGSVWALPAFQGDTAAAAIRAAHAALVTAGELMPSRPTPQEADHAAQ